MQPLSQIIRLYFGKENALTIMSGNYRPEEEYERMLDPVRKILQTANYNRLEIWSTKPSSPSDPLDIGIDQNS